MKRLVFLAAAALALSACSQKVDTKAEAVAGEDLAKYSDHVKDKVELGKDSGLVQLFCLHSTGAKCAEGIEAQLKDYGFDGTGTTLDLANAMVKLYADVHDKTPDQYSSDEDFLAAAYQVVLGRAPDQGGAKANFDLIQQGNDNRRPVVRSLIESEEFKNMSAPTAAAAAPASPAAAPATATPAVAAPATPPPAASPAAATPAATPTKPAPAATTPAKPAASPSAAATPAVQPTP
jgi:hypothetical protein